MNCEKCKTGEMNATKVPRFSGCLVAIGYTLLIPSILGILLATCVAVVGTSATGKATVEGVEDAKARAVEQLREIRNLPPEIIADFEDDGLIDDAALSGLSQDQRRQVEAVKTMHGASVTGTALGGTMAAGIGSAMVLVVYFISIPALVLGFVLLLKRKVWKCNSCGYIFDRA